MTLEIHPEAANRFNQIASELVQAFRRVQKAPPRQPLPPELMPHIAATLTEKDGIKDLILHSIDAETGLAIGVQMVEGNELYQLDAVAYGRLVHLVRSFCGQAAWRDVVGEPAVEAALLSWLQHALRSSTGEPAVTYVQHLIASQIRNVTIIVPLFHVRSLSAFTLGPHRLSPSTSAEIEAWFTASGNEIADGEGQQRAAATERWKKKSQGMVALHYGAQAERGLAMTRARSAAEDACVVLRLFTSAIMSTQRRAYIAAIGSEGMSARSALVLDGGRITEVYEGQELHGSIGFHVEQIRADKVLWGELQAWGSLLEERRLSEYEEKLLTAARIYSRAALEHKLTEKLLHVIVACETMLLRNSSESIQANVGLRAAFLVGRDVDERLRAVELFNKAYEKRSAFMHHGRQAQGDEDMSDFLLMARGLFAALLAQRVMFESKDSLIAALERRKLE